MLFKPGKKNYKPGKSNLVKSVGSNKNKNKKIASGMKVFNPMQKAMGSQGLETRDFLDQQIDAAIKG